VFETSVDDYAEVWVDGELTRTPGQRGGSVVAGGNASNRLVIARDVKPGQKIQLAIFGANGPLSNPPTNFIWVREAKLDFYRGSDVPLALTPSEVNVQIVKNDPAMEQIVGPNPKIFKLAEGFKFTEGPVWIPEAQASKGHLLFSDPNSNVVYKYTPNGNERGKLDVFRTPSGYSGAGIAEYGQPGSNGLTLDPQGRLTISQHGNRRIVRITDDLKVTAVVERFEGKRFNSPNDVVYRSDGSLYFTDPPYGLPKFDDDPAKELPFNGVYKVTDGKVQLLVKDLTRPNGLAFSPDEKTMYVANSDENYRIWMRYDVAADGTLSNGRVFKDVSAEKEEGLPDGMKIDSLGNIWATGPGGIWVFTPEGQHLGTIKPPEQPANCAWGDPDWKTLYITAVSGLYRLKTSVRGQKLVYS